MPFRTPDDCANVARPPMRTGAGEVTLNREIELLREIARALAREAAREAFDRALADQTGRQNEEAE